jgi:hypothetical protein
MHFKKEFRRIFKMQRTARGSEVIADKYSMQTSVSPATLKSSARIINEDTLSSVTLSLSVYRNRRNSKKAAAGTSSIWINVLPCFCMPPKK